MRVVTAADCLAGAVVALGGAVGATWLMAPLPAQPEPTLSEADVRGIVQAYLTEKPDVVIDAIRAFQAREDKREAEATASTGVGVRSLHEAMDRVVQNVRALHDERDKLDPYRVHGRIDELFVDDLNLFDDLFGLLGAAALGGLAPAL